MLCGEWPLLFCSFCIVVFKSPLVCFCPPLSCLIEKTSSMTSNTFCIISSIQCVYFDDVRNYCAQFFFGGTFYLFSLTARQCRVSFLSSSNYMSFGPCAVYSCMNVSCTVYYTASTHKVTLIIAMMVKNLWFGCARGIERIHLHRWHWFTFFCVLIMNQLSFGNLSPTLLSGDIFTCEKWAPTKPTQCRTHVCAVVVFVFLFCCISVMLCTCTCIVSTGHSARENLIISCY